MSAPTWNRPSEKVGASARCRSGSQLRCLCVELLGAQVEGRLLLAQRGRLGRRLLVDGRFLGCCELVDGRFLGWPAGRAVSPGRQVGFSGRSPRLGEGLVALDLVNCPRTSANWDWVVVSLPCSVTACLLAASSFVWSEAPAPTPTPTPKRTKAATASAVIFAHRGNDLFLGLGVGCAPPAASTTCRPTPPSNRHLHCAHSMAGTGFGSSEPPGSVAEDGVPNKDRPLTVPTSAVRLTGSNGTIRPPAQASPTMVRPRLWRSSSTRIWLATSRIPPGPVGVSAPSARDGGRSRSPRRQPSPNIRTTPGRGDHAG
jgi:hypothetical protein